LAYFATILFLIIATLFAWYSKDLPNPYKFSKRAVAESSKILDRNGKLLYEIHGDKNRTLISFDDMPDYVKQATIAIEDKDFYKHSGFDIKGIIRAFFYNVSHQDTAQGGSTITQQLVKNAILSSKKTISRKIQEFIMAIELEKIYSKDEILKMYLNEIPYGNNAYGIEAAAQTYFAKKAKNLTLAESALLAAIPRAPTFYSPYGSNTDALLARKDYILDRMAELYYITPDQAASAKKEKLKFQEQKTNILAPHFVMYVKEKLVDEFGEKMLEEGGLTITTTLDLEKQKIAEETIAEAAKTNLKQNGAKNASLVALDPKTGQILAMVGSIDYFDKTIDGNVNVAVRDRQPGSSIKPIVYATAFKQGLSPATMLIDVLTDFGNGYKPENYDLKTRGPVSIRTALGNSLNIPAVKTLFLAGVENSCKTARDLGITTLTDPDRYGLSLVLGGGEVKLLELVGAYGVFANSGIRQEITPFLKIEDSKGQVIKEYKNTKGKEVLDPQVAYLITDILSDDSARAMIFGRGGVLTLPGRPVAAKTGTTDEFRDAWTVGYTPSLVAGVWVGNNDNSPMASHAAGSMAAAPIWHNFMEKTLEGTTVEKFERPKEIKTITVEAISGKLPLENIPPELKDEYKTKTEVFASFAVPKERDDIHKIVKIIKGSENLEEGPKVAAENCPPGLIETKIFSVFHSERPEMANWEGPVQAWAKQQGYNKIPENKEDCAEFVEKNKPSVSITSPAQNSQNTGELIATIDFTAPLGVERVDWTLDEELIGYETASPFSLNFEIPDTVSGSFTLKAKLYDKVGLTSEDKIKVNLTPDPTRPKIILEKTSENNTQILFTAIATPYNEDSIEKVVFYLDETAVATITTPTSGNKYLYTWEKATAPGIYRFYARAFAASGVSKKSNYFNIEIKEQKPEKSEKESSLPQETTTSQGSANPLSGLVNLNH